MREDWYIHFNDVYETMLGLREPEAQVPWVENAFEEGYECAIAYEEVRQAYERLCERLGVGDEDEDLNLIIENMELIQKELCLRMAFLETDHFISHEADKLLNVKQRHIRTK